MPDRVPGPGEHWWCPACGTFDGPHHEEFCDVCADGTCIDGLVPRAEVERLRGAIRQMDEIAQHNTVKHIARDALSDSPPSDITALPPESRER